MFTFPIGWSLILAHGSGIAVAILLLAVLRFMVWPAVARAMAT